MAIALKIVAVILGLIFAVPNTLRLLYLMLRHPIKFFKKKDRTNPPYCLISNSWNHNYARLSKIRLHYVEAGDQEKPLMVMIHGFPEFWYSWRHQILEFSKDYRVVAVDNRGYGDSDKPSRVADYDINYLSNDIKLLIQYLGYKSAIVVAHDWGGVIAYALAMDNPEMVSHLICMNGPHPGAFRERIEGSLKQFLKSWYTFFFQIPFIPELMVSCNDYAVIKAMFKKPPMGLQKGTFTDEDVEAFKYNISQPGCLTAGINYYRANMTNDRDMSVRIKMPHLVIFGTDDGALDKEIAINTAKFCDDFTLKLVEGASHWVQQDEPEKVNQYMRDFLARKA